MKKNFAVFTLFAALIFVIGCGGGSSKPADGGDTGETVNDEDSDTADSELADDSEPSDTNPEDPDNPDTTPDNPDSDDPDTTPDNGDSQPDNGDTEPDNDYPQTPCDPNPCISVANSTGVCTINNNSYVCGCNPGYIFDGTLCIKSLPECSPESATPCIDSATGIIWSAKSANKMPWNDAVNYCQNLTEGDFDDWRLPSIAVLRTLVQNCSSAKCAEDYTGKYSKFGDTVYLWSSSEGAGSTAKSIYFSDASTSSISTDTNVNVRCVRRETESRESNCTGLIENSVWNTATQITQTWDWETAGWTPSPEGSYNTVASSSECRFKCDSSSFREGSRCLNPCKPNPCNSIGETGSCIGKSAHEYRCECENNYFWSPYSYECMKNLSCQQNICDIPNSTGTCNPVTETQYACECSGGYYWHGTTNECKTEPLTLGNICTGQNKCYANSGTMTCPAEGEDFFGQDAWYASLGKCAPQSFTVQTISSEKVVVDNNTGLMWQQTIPTSTYTTWAYAVSYCENLEYAGYTDWRLPTPKELLTIVDNSKYGPAIDTSYGPAIDTSYFPDTPSSNFWSSSTGVDDTRNAWCVSFYNGFVGGNDKTTSSYYVRCVRGAALPTGSFTSSTIQGDVIVTDTETGLIWQKTYVSDKTWQQALSYCESLTYAGYSDWRLPNKNELASLINYEKYDPASDFPDMPSNYFWSSSTESDSTVYAWNVFFYNGYVYNGSKTYNFNVRCVR